MTIVVSMKKVMLTSAIHHPSGTNRDRTDQIITKANPRIKAAINLLRYCDFTSLFSELSIALPFVALWHTEEAP